MDWLNNLFPKNLFPTKLGGGRIFLDYASATPVRPEVRQVMEKYWSESFHNPSAIYEEGIAVKKEMDDYRARVARILGAGQKEIIFTASGTESVNLAILGTFEESRREFKKPHLIISEIEHAAVARAAAEVARRGGELSVLPVNEEGLISLEVLNKTLKKNTFLVSVGLANSEIGAVQPLAKIGRVLREQRKKRGAGPASPSAYPLLHTDASQAPSYLPVNLESLQCDLLSLDGSKIYGPKGAGCLAVRRGVKIRPIILGGSQEQGRRAGTLNTALIAGFTTALEQAVLERELESKRLENLRQLFIESVAKSLPRAVINGSAEHHLPNIVSVSMPGTLAELVLLKLDAKGVMVSVGTACSLDERVSGSPVIRALGKPELSESTIRFSFGKFTMEKEVKQAAEIFWRVCSNMIK